MTWQKQGLIYNHDGKLDWAQHTVLTPQPFVLNDEVIRIYAGFRDNAGVSRIGYIDVDATNPSNVLGVSPTPVLDVGRDGMFDDNGLLLGDVVRHDDEIRMYYVGFQLPSKAKFMAFSGMAVSTDGGEHFQRVQETSVMDRQLGANFIRAIHTVLRDDGVWKVWYSVGDDWELINGVKYPQYHIMYTESLDGVTFPDPVGTACVLPTEEEYRIGRPRVFKTASGYEMHATSDTYNKTYMAQRLTSLDGKTWTRTGETVLPLGEERAWDGESVCYPVTVETAGKRYLFYSGNGMGRSGVGYAEWHEPNAGQEGQASS